MKKFSAFGINAELAEEYISAQDDETLMEIEDHNGSPTHDYNLNHFLNDWNKLETFARNIWDNNAKRNKIQSSNKMGSFNFYQTQNLLREKDVLSKEDIRMMDELRRTRNILVHSVNREVRNQDLKPFGKVMRILLRKLENASKQQA